MSRAPFIYLEDQVNQTRRFYDAPLREVIARKREDIKPALVALKAAFQAGHFLAGYCSYDWHGLISDNPDIARRSDMPLLHFGVFDGFDTQRRPEAESYNPLPALAPEWDETAYLSRFDRVKRYIEAGDIYQVNLTFPFSGQTSQRPDFPAKFAELMERQPVRYGGVLHLGEIDILTLSPELFFRIKNGQVFTRPMKGTAPRRADPEADLDEKDRLALDEKNRAENLMIVDLLRNDISPVCTPGSVRVSDLYSIESYPTLHQMTSGVEGRLQAGRDPIDVLAHLFPCGSVTGAPKIRAMEIIRELETGPRGPYCGAIGYIDPDSRAEFNVAIRTLYSRSHGETFITRYGVGSGVVYDSDGPAEYAECLLKSEIVTQIPALIETLGWSPDSGFIRLELHMARLGESAANLGYALDFNAIFNRLDEAIAGKTTAQRIRLSLQQDGQIDLTISPLQPLKKPLRFAVSKFDLTAERQRFDAKISDRTFYDGERARLSRALGIDEAVFLNAEGELCEGSFTSLFFKMPEEPLLLTPALSSGLLKGVLRQDMILQNKARACRLTLDDMKRAEKIYLGNSLRGLMQARAIDFDRH